MKQTNTFLFGLFVLCSMIMFFGPTSNWAWDPSFYYAHIRSPIIEHDLDFRNETLTGSIQLPYTETGLQHSLWPIGPSILWSPFFLLAHNITLLINPEEANGFSPLYISLVSVGSAFYGVIGLSLMHWLNAQIAGDRVAGLITILSLGATPLFFYIFRQPIMAHTTGLFAAAWMLVVFYQHIQPQHSASMSGLLFGVTLGLTMSTRWQGVVMGFLPLLYYTKHLFIAIKTRSIHYAFTYLLQIGVMIGVVLLILSPQFVLWYHLHGTPFVLPQSGESFVGNWLPVHIFDVFIHTNRGVILWSPFIFIGILSIVGIPNWELRLGVILVIVGQILIISYRTDWYGGGGFGVRYFIELLPFTGIGLAYAVKRHPIQTPWRFVLGVSAAFLIAHQLVLVYEIERLVTSQLGAVAYMQGRILGIQWQGLTFKHLLQQPLAWLAPRPYVDDDRQTIITNLLAGVRDWRMYYVTGIALIVTPLIIGLFGFGVRTLRQQHVGYISLGVIIYFVLWARFLLFIGW